MKIKSFINSIILIAAGGLAADRANAAVFSVDINDASQPANTQSGFNALATPGGSFTSLSGSFSGVGIAITGLGETLQSSVRSSPVNTTNFSSAALYQDSISGGATNGNGIGILLSGLTPYQNYTIQIWSYDALSPVVPVSDWTANGVLVASKFSFDPGSYRTGGFSFPIAASGSGEIYITGRHNAAQPTGAAVFFNALEVSTAASATAVSPHTSSWLTANSGKYARIYTTDEARTNGVTLTTWTNGTHIQSLPAYVGVQEIYSSSNWLYIRSSGLAHHVMGAWYLGGDRTQLFPGWPLNQKVFYRIPRTGSVPTTKTLTTLGAIGYGVDGVGLYDTEDGRKWTGTSEGNGGVGFWYRDAYVNESPSFDPANAHQPGSGQYHYHANPIALRFLLDDHVDFDPVTKIYTESTNAVTKHSPILGWMADGFPAYGPYGFSNATNSASGVRRMRSGYVLRNGQSNTANLTLTGRTAIPAWAARAYNVSTNQTGPTVSTNYPLGRYMEDNDYLGDLGYTQGVHFDLNEWNVRWCVTPEFPNGIWAYFASINSDGSPAYPYNIGRSYFGAPTGGPLTNLSETVTTNFVGEPNLRETLNAPSKSGDIVTLTWSALEGGTYQVESSTNLNGWTTNATSLAATLNTGGYTNASPEDAKFYRVARTALAAYDPVTSTTTSGGGTSILSVSPTSGSRGTTLTLTINLNPTSNPPAAGAPVTSVTVGGITGTGNTHTTQTVVTSSITIPGGAATGAQTVTVTFTSMTGVIQTFTLAGGFTIN